MSNIWIAIISSSVISGIVGAVIGGMFSLRGKRNEYVNDYYKTIIKRRIAAYEKAETLVASLRPEFVAPDDPRRPYHMPFASEDAAKWKNTSLLMFDVLSQGLWLSGELFDETRDLNRILYPFDKPESLVKYGREVYSEVAARRQRIERQIARDMLELHNIPQFLRRKNRPDPGEHRV